MKILANDGLSRSGIDLLENNGFEVLTTTVAQEQLVNFINTHKIEALLVRSATKVGKEIILGCPTLKLVGRGGAGMDNIDVALAKEKRLHVVNTPGASAGAVAELVFAHLFSGVRFLHDANRNMPLEGDRKFNLLKKGYSNGMELHGKTLGIIGFGRIGQATAKIALGIGMQVLYADPQVETAHISLSFYNGKSVDFDLLATSKENVLRQADFVSVHVPAQGGYLIGKQELALMKDGAGIINTARGGVVDEVALIAALESGKISFAGLDVFESEPSPEIQILMHPGISLSPHIGASTEEAQDRIAMDLAAQIIELLK